LRIARYALTNWRFHSTNDGVALRPAELPVSNHLSMAGYEGMLRARPPT
jgi:hypothetical protein